MAGYSPSSQNAAAPTPFTQPSGTEAKFYWYSGGSSTTCNDYSVVLTGNLGPFAGTTTFCVFTPTVTFTATTGSIVVCPPAQCGSSYVDPAFAFGDYTNGINWTVTINSPPGGNGSFGMFQLLNSTRTRTLDPQNTVQTLSTNSTYVLDNGGDQLWYFSESVGNSQKVTATSNDEPGNDLSSSYKLYYDSDAFTDYIMYEPNGGIPVPLGSIMNWSWSAGVTKQANGTWTLNPGSAHSTNPSSSINFAFPSWTSGISQYKYQ